MNTRRFIILLTYAVAVYSIWTLWVADWYCEKRGREATQAVYDAGVAGDRREHAQRLVQVKPAIPEIADPRKEISLNIALQGRLRLIGCPD